MDCNRAHAWSPLMVDRELGPLRRFLAARHIANCAGCGAQVKELLSMREVIRTNLPFYRAPPHLAARIGAMLPRNAPLRPSRPWFPTPAFGFAGSGLAGALAGVALTMMVFDAPWKTNDAVTQSVIGSHIRPMMADHLTDVLTSDRHTVKPWLSARLYVSSPVIDLIAEGFALVGGRMDYVDGHPAAAVVFRRDKHLIILFAWALPSVPDVALRSEQRQGFNIIARQRDGVSYCGVSDPQAQEPIEFGKLDAVNT